MTRRSSSLASSAISASVRPKAKYACSGSFDGSSSGSTASERIGSSGATDCVRHQRPNPRMISRVDYHPPFPGFTHTALPLFDRELMIVTDESVTEDCSDHPKLTWVMDIREESHPVIISTFPMPSKDEFCARGGRFGSHNIHENLPVPTSWSSDTIIVGSYFNAGVRVHDISDPFRPEEVAYYIPEVPAGANGVNINDVYVDENGLIYAIDRFKGGLYILEMEL